MVVYKACLLTRQFLYYVLFCCHSCTSASTMEAIILCTASHWSVIVSTIKESEFRHVEQPRGFSKKSSAQVKNMIYVSIK